MKHKYIFGILMLAGLLLLCIPAYATPPVVNGYCLPLDNWGVTSNMYYSTSATWDSANNRYTVSGGWHGGTDLEAAYGTNVYAVTNGTIRSERAHV